MRLVAKDLSFTYDGEHYLWKDVSLTVHKGEIFSIMGANGCGKSTLIKSLIGFLHPETGSVFLELDDGTVLNPVDDAKEYTKHIGYAPQMQDSSYSYTIRDYVVMGRAVHLGLFSKPGKRDYELTDEVLQEMHLYEIRNQSFNTLSGGQQRQAVIARAIVQQPDLVVMDEPTNHLDYGNQYRVIEMIEKLAARGISVVLTTHMPDQAMYFGSICGIMLHQHLYVGQEAVIITEKTLRELYGIDIKMIRVPGDRRRICVANPEC